MVFFRILTHEQIFLWVCVGNKNQELLHQTEVGSYG